MNKQLWKLYKESPQGKACIELFDPDVENTSEGAFNIWKHASKWGEDEVEDSFAGAAICQNVALFLKSGQKNHSISLPRIMIS